MKDSNTIKLVKLDESDDGKVIRLASSLYVARNVADFIIRDGQLECWSKGENGFDFYKTNQNFEIVNSEIPIKK